MVARRAARSWRAWSSWRVTASAGADTGRRHAPRHADPALRLPDAGEPHLRQLLRHLPRRGRDPAGHLHARLDRAPRRRCIKPSTGSATSRSPTSATPQTQFHASSTTAGRWTASSGELRQRPRRHHRDGLLRRPRPAVLLERRRQLRALRPVLHLGDGGQRGQPHVLGDRAARASRGRPSASLPADGATSRRSSTGCRRPG